MPKISRHGGPTHKGDPPKPSRKSFGEALRAARAGQEPSPADETQPQPEQVTVTLDFTAADERLAELVRKAVRVDYAADDLPPSVTVTAGDGEPSTFGDLTAEGGSGSSDQSDHDATDVQVTTEPEGGEQPSAGTSSSTSSRKRRTNSGEPKQTGQSRARATASRSKRAAAEPSIADSTATSGPEMAPSSDSPGE